MTRPAVIICEREPRWSRLLRRDLPQWSDRVRETRSSSQARAELQSHRGGLLVMELSDQSLAPRLELLLWLLDAGLAFRTVTTGAARYAGLGAEAGAVAHFESFWQAETLARLARRQLKQPLAEAEATDDRGGLEARWRERLPWRPLSGGTASV